MPFTNFPHGVTSFGRPITASSNRFFGWNDANTYFVDGDNGSDSNNGLSPDRAFDTVAAAIAAAGADDVIYIRERAWTDTDPTAYREVTDSMIITSAKKGLSLIGTGSNLSNSFGVQINAAASDTGTVLTVRAPSVAIENIDFNRGASTSTNGLVYFQYDETSSTLRAEGCSISNCHIRNASQADMAGIKTNGAWYLDIVGNTFVNCRFGVQVYSGVSVTNGVRIIGNYFTNGGGTTDGAQFDAHIAVNGGPHYGLVIDRNVFATALPALSGGAWLRYIRINGTADGIVSNNVFASRSDLTYGATGSGAIIPTTVGFVNNYGDEGASGTQLLARA